MGFVGLQLISKPITEIISVSDIKAYSRIDSSYEDNLLLDLITAAREYCEEYTGRSFIEQSWALTTDNFNDDNIIELPRAPIISIDSVQYLDTDGALQTLGSGFYQADINAEPGRLKVLSMPDLANDRLNKLPINYTSGYGKSSLDVPKAIIHAAQILVLFYYDNRSMPGSAPDAVKNLLNPFKVKYI